MDFSIVTPSYNYGRYIGECLASVARQEGATFEHLVMDAGSTDQTAEVVSGFAHVSFFQEPDKGMSEAINKGFLKAKGRWVMWLNADDFLLPNALRKVLECVARNPQADVVFGTYRIVDAQGVLVRTMKLLPYSRFISVHYGCYVPSTATFLNRERTIAQGFMLDERMRTVMDNEYYARLSVAGRKFVYAPQVLAAFRVHDENLSCVGGVKRGTLTDELRYANMGTETEAVRRTYGITLFGNIMLNHALDFGLYLLAWGLKGLLKLPYWFATRES